MAALASTGDVRLDNRSRKRAGKAPCSFCPPGHGCNDSVRQGPCALTICSAAAAEDQRAATEAIMRWRVIEERLPGSSRRQRRFQRRAFERARDRALIVIALGAHGNPEASRASDSRSPSGRDGRSGGRRGDRAGRDA